MGLAASTVSGVFGVVMLGRCTAVRISPEAETRNMRIETSALVSGCRVDSIKIICGASPLPLGMTLKILCVLPTVEITCLPLIESVDSIPTVPNQVLETLKLVPVVRTNVTTEEMLGVFSSLPVDTGLASLIAGTVASLGAGTIEGLFGGGITICAKAGAETAINKKGDRIFIIGASFLRKLASLYIIS